MVDDSPIQAALDAARRGRPERIEQLYTDHQPPLLRYLRSQEPNLADDIASEVWLAAATLETFDGDEDGFRAWLFTVARRRLIEHRRRAGRRRTDPVDPDRLLADPDPADPTASTMDSLDAREAVDRIVQHLTADQSEVLILRVVAGMSAAEVAELMGRRETWVRTVQHRALKHLARHLDSRAEVLT